MTHVFEIVVEKLDRDNLLDDISKQEGDNDLASRDLLHQLHKECMVS